MNIYDFAMSIEKSGMKFYSKMVEATDDPGLKKIFSMMIKDEEFLFQQYEKMRDKAPKRALKDARGLAEETNVFAEELDPQKVLAKIDNDLDAYRFIMAVEEKLYKMYEKVAEQEEDAQLKNKLLEIAQVEHREHDEIQAAYDFVNAPNEHLAWGEFSNLGEFHNFGRDDGSRSNE
ncbi:MAG TPA: ferritin family protein [Desulfuromonadales bacterium]|nr:ferritin family protein [Desulfuromonadales bacterium]